MKGSLKPTQEGLRINADVPQEKPDGVLSMRASNPLSCRPESYASNGSRKTVVMRA